MVVDFFSLAAMKITKAINIPLVINFPGSCELLKVLNVPTLSKNLSVLGLTVFFDPIGLLLPKKMMPLRNTGPFVSSSLVLVNSFWGFDNALSLPPNFKLIGPSFEPALIKKFEP